MVSPRGGGSPLLLLEVMKSAISNHGFLYGNGNSYGFAALGVKCFSRVVELEGLLPRLGGPDVA
jgi:hypothetical protein